jgi:hypothetical protein
VESPNFGHSHLRSVSFSEKSSHLRAT